MVPKVEEGKFVFLKKGAHAHRTNAKNLNN